MKKTHDNKKMHLSARIFIVCLLLFNSFFLCTCGLEIYDYIEGPDYLIHRPYEESSYENKYFEFKTKVSDNQKLKGTAVYYRIYNSLSKMNTDVGNITTYIYSDDNKAKAADLLFATNEKNQGFKPLLYWDPKEELDYTESILVDKQTYGTTSSHDIKIRLSDYQYKEGDELSIEQYAYMAYIIFDEDNDNFKRPRRYVDNLTFNFGRYSTETNSRIPDKEDLDVCYSETTSEEDENRWYVPLFAIGIAINADYSPFYSVPLYLGYVIIRDDEIDN